MNHIFYIHSNILAICCYQIVQEVLAKKDKVIIITNRNCPWPFFQSLVTVYDFAEIFHGEDRQRIALHNLRAIKDYIRYRKYRRHLNIIINRIIAGEDFILYLPSMALDMPMSFAYNKNCKGYYYVDEGSLAYLPQDLINQQFAKSFKNDIKRLLNIEDHCHYEILPTFKGTISITKDAFQWNDKWDKIVNSLDDCIIELKKDLPVFDDVIVTAKLVGDIGIIKKSIDFTVANIVKNRPNSKIGIKLHPNAITYNKDKTEELINYIKDRYNDKITIISKDVPIEIMSLVYHPNLYSLLVVSSLILYGLLFRSSDGYLIKHNDMDSFTRVKISTTDEYYSLISKVNLGK